jgi:hypothetical protein
MVILKGSLSEYCYPPLRRQEHRVTFFCFPLIPLEKAGLAGRGKQETKAFRQHDNIFD